MRFPLNSGPRKPYATVDIDENMVQAAKRRAEELREVGVLYVQCPDEDEVMRRLAAAGVDIETGEDERFVLSPIPPPAVLPEERFPHLLLPSPGIDQQPPEARSVGRVRLLARTDAMPRERPHLRYGLTRVNCSAMSVTMIGWAFGHELVGRDAKAARMKLAKTRKAAERDVHH